MARVQTPRDELADFLDNSSIAFLRSARKMIRTKLEGDAESQRIALEEMAELLAQTMTLADLHGRRRMLLESDAIIKRTPKSEVAPLLHADVLFQSIDDRITFSTTPVVPKVPFLEAIEDLLRREPRIAATAQAVSDLYSQRHSFALARSLDTKLTRRVQKALASFLEIGIPEPTVGKVIADMGDWTESYGQTVYRTNMSTAYGAGRFRQVFDPDVARVIGGFKFMVVRDSDARGNPKTWKGPPDENHWDAHGLTASTTDSVWERFYPPMGYNSFVPGTRIGGKIESASKAWYAGPIAEINTKMGLRLTVTINHPVLTDNGFVAAANLREGDGLICHRPSVKSFSLCSGNRGLPFVLERWRAQNHEHIPPRIDDVFKACLAHRTSFTIESFPRPLPLDFHGDARFYHGNVHVIGSDGLLPDSRPSITECSDDIPFMLGEMSALLLSHGSSMLLTSEHVSIGPAARLDASRQNPISDASPGDTKLFRDLQFRYSREVALDYVTRIKISSYTGHVYDLQSPLGWIVAEGLVVSNCRCTARMVGKRELEKMGLLAANGTVQRLEPPGFENAAPHPNFGRGRPDRQLYGGV